MPLARGVFDESRVARSKHVLRAVTQADLELSRKDDHELTPRRRMPVEELAGRPLAEGDLARGQPLQPVRFRLELDLLDVRLLIGARVHPKCSHRFLPVRTRTVGMLAQIRKAPSRADACRSVRVS